MNEPMQIEWLNIPIATPNGITQRAAEARQAVLTKPPGALGRLEEIAIRLAAMQGSITPSVEQIQISVFAGDHGIAMERVSAFPQAVTAEMVKNFARGGAAICVAARKLGAPLEVINLGTAFDTGPLEGVENYALGPGTASFSVTAAMNKHQLTCALAAGRHAVERAKLNGAQLFIGGEMGIANTSAATALASLLLNISPTQLTGPGTGLDATGVAHKISVIETALALHRPHTHSPLEALRRVGGFEMAALVGAYISCGQMGIPVLIDGFISSSAALVAAQICPAIKEWLLYSHTSAEPGHLLILESLHALPLLDLGMRLGEGSGAAIAVPLLRMACDLHNEMATFAEAAISEKC